MTSLLNLLSSLPVELQCEIYKYEDTYRIFGNGDFQEELTSAYLRSRLSFKKCHAKITEHVEDLINEGNTCWQNKYGRIVPVDELTTTTSHLPIYNSAEDFMIVCNYYYDVLYFKILPKDACYENCDFFHNIFHKRHIYDGYFRNENKNNNLSKNQLDNMCIGSTSNIESYNMNDQLIKQDISMYFV
jgi:hypothetical protein